MQHVDIMFFNIQSHESTKFSLGPGFNVILSSGNNVGKSAIFKALRCVAEAPRPFMDLAGLLRGGCNQGYVSFKFDGYVITYWLYRKDSGVVSGFFEVRDKDGMTTREARCPAILLNALGITLGANGRAVNFNDAASIQLLVEDSTENDQILAKVLFDENVDRLKCGIADVYNKARADIASFEQAVRYTSETLSGLEYNDAVDFFDSVESKLDKYATFLDNGVPELSTTPKATVSDKEWKVVDSLHSVVQSFSAIDFEGLIQKSSSFNFGEELELCAALNAVYTELGNVKVDVQASIESRNSLAEMASLLQSAQAVLKSILRIQDSRDSDSKLLRLTQEQDEVVSNIKSMAQEVNCPVKGRCYYTNEKCVFLGD